MPRASLLFALLFFLLFSGWANAADITINTGETFVATIGLSAYENVCASQVPPCPTFPVGILPFVWFEDPTSPFNQYSLEATLKSTNDGQEFFIGSLPLEITTLGEQVGLFRYNGGLSGFPIPNDPTFWGPNPSTDTIQVVFQNTGAPFALLFDPTFGFTTPEGAVEGNLDSSEDGSGIRVGEPTISVAFSQVPEPMGLGALTSAVLLVVCLFRRTKLVR